MYLNIHLYTVTHTALSYNSHTYIHTHIFTQSRVHTHYAIVFYYFIIQFSDDIKI